MTPILFADITVFVLSLLVGFEVISKVPATLHTPLMSGANAIHGVVVVGVMILAASLDSPVGYALLVVAAVFAAMNVVGGYLVTDRMLEMFRPRPAGPPAASAGSTPSAGTPAAPAGSTPSAGMPAAPATSTLNGVTGR